MLSNYEEYGFEITAKNLPEDCVSCPFWMTNMDGSSGGMCFITGREMGEYGTWDRGRADDCPITVFEMED